MLILLLPFTCVNTDKLSKAKIKSTVAEKRAVISWPNPGFPAKWNLMLIPRLRVLTSQRYTISAGRINSNVILRGKQSGVLLVFQINFQFFNFFIWFLFYIYLLFTYYLFIWSSVSSIQFFFIYLFIFLILSMYSLVYFLRSYSDGHLSSYDLFLCKCRCRCGEMSAFFHATAQCPI